MAAATVWLIIMGVIVIGGVGLVFGPALVQLVGSRDTRQELKASRKREAIATKALRQIANERSGNPVMDASVALDDIDATYNYKELN